MLRRRGERWLWIAPAAALAAGLFALFVLRTPMFWLYELVPFAVFLIALHHAFTETGERTWSGRFALLMLWCAVAAGFPFAYGTLLASH